MAVAPEASKLREHITDADKAAAAIATGATEARKAATAAREEAARLKQNKTASEAELTKLWLDLQTVETRNLFLETETTRLTANLTDARRTAGILQEYASAKDAEADRLRAGHDHLATQVADHATQLSAAHRAAQDHRSRADKLAGEVRLYRIALAIVAAILIAWVALRIFLRP